jgi:site-specific DNA-methyltransferase (adenine-specific)
METSLFENIKNQYLSSGLEPNVFFDKIKKNYPLKKERKIIKNILKESLPNEKKVYCKLYNIDIKDYKNKIKKDSIDWIITDPPYPKKYLYLYEILSEMSSYALKETGGLIVMTGQSYIPEILNLLSKHLNYVWTLAYLTPGGQSPYLWQRKCNTFWKPLFLFSKSKYKGDSFGDVIKTSANNNDKNHHYWGQSVEGFDMLIKKFTYPYQVILDPFIGGGTTAIAALKNNRSCIGFDNDESCIKTAKMRIKNEL